MEQPLFKVNECTTRDGLNLLMKQLKINDNEEKRALGIEVEEEGELDKGFRDIVELFNDSERRSWRRKMLQRNKKLEPEASQAE